MNFRMIKEELWEENVLFYQDLVDTSGLEPMVDLIDRPEKQGLYQLC